MKKINDLSILDLAGLFVLLGLGCLIWFASTGSMIPARFMLVFLLMAGIMFQAGITARKVDKKLSTRLPQKWVEFLNTLPENGMGYQIVDVEFPHKIFYKQKIFNGQFVSGDLIGEDLTKIISIVPA